MPLGAVRCITQLAGKLWALALKGCVGYGYRHVMLSLNPGRPGVCCRLTCSSLPPALQHSTVVFVKGVLVGLLLTLSGLFVLSLAKYPSLTPHITFMWVLAVGLLVLMTW